MKTRKRKDLNVKQRRISRNDPRRWKSRQLTRDLEEANEEQIATSTILKTITSGAYDLQTVLDTVVESTARLSSADGVDIWWPLGDQMRLVASYRTARGHKKFIGNDPRFIRNDPITPDRARVTGRTILEDGTVDITAILEDPEFTALKYKSERDYQTILDIPLQFDGHATGVIALMRTVTRSFSEKQIARAQLFAYQAAIAIAKVTALGSSRELQVMLDSIPALAWRTRRDGFTEYVSGRWLDYTGFSLERALGWGWLAAIQPDDVEQLQDKWRQILASESPGEAEARMRRFDGEYRWFLFRAQPMRDANGVIIAWYGTNTDIEDRKSIEYDLQRSERRYRYLFEFMPIAMWQIDLQGVTKLIKGLRVQGVTDLSAYLNDNPTMLDRMMDSLVALDVNDATVTMFGATSRGELLGPCGFFWKTSPDTFRRAMESRFRGETIFQEETKFVTLSGREINVLFTTARLEQAGELALCGLVDVTERTLAQGKLHQLQAEFAHAARISVLGELMASIAHELNQPLGAIQANGEAGLRWLTGGTPNVAKARQLIQRAVDDTGRAADIIARIRTMAMRGAPQWAEFSLHQALKDALVFLRGELQSKRVFTDVDLVLATPFVIGDQIQLQQVIVNLAINAIQAMAKCTEPRKLLIRTTLSDTRVVCSFEDSGPGIDSCALGRIFGSFFTTKETGLGLGLPLSKSIIEAHGGELYADNNSALGGARFTFTLPTKVAE